MYVRFVIIHDGEIFFFAKQLRGKGIKRMKRYIRSSVYSESEKRQRRIVRSIAEEVLREHGENNSIGTYDRFLRAMMDRWALSAVMIVSSYML